MAWLLLEAGVALGIGLFIVWWTWPTKKRGATRQSGKDDSP